MLHRPTPLRPGDVVRVVAPSGNFERDKLVAGLRIIEEAGLVPVYDDGLFSAHRYLAGSDERRLAELRTALGDSRARAIWTARGGYGATRLLPHLPVDAVRRADKWLVGFSDTTALHASWSRAGVASLHGANVTTLAGWSPDARRELFGWLFSPAPRIFRGRTLGGSQLARGPLLGGNLTVLAAMAGTPHLPSLRGAIVLLEDVGERPYRLDRSLTQLIHAGVFEGVAGFAIGQLTECVEPLGKPEIDALTVVGEVLAPLGAPVLGELAIGHEASSRAVLLGADATLDPVEQALTLAPAEEGTRG